MTSLLKGLSLFIKYVLMQDSHVRVVNFFLVCNYSLFLYRMDFMVFHQYRVVCVKIYKTTIDNLHDFTKVIDTIFLKHEYRQGKSILRVPNPKTSSVLLQCDV